MSSTTRFGPAPWPYLLALAAVALATTVAAADELTVAAGPALFFLAVMASAAVGGIGPGLLAMAAAGLVTSYVVLAPRGRLTVDGPAAGLLGLYLAAAAAGLAVARRRAARRLRVRPRQVGQVARLLARVPLFAGASDADRAAAAAAMRVRLLPARAGAADLGEPGSEFFLVVRGRVEVRRHGQVADVLGPGQWYGEGGLAGRPTQPDQFRGRADAVLLVLSRAALRDTARRRRTLAAVLAAAGERTRPSGV